MEIKNESKWHCTKKEAWLNNPTPQQFMQDAEDSAMSAVDGLNFACSWMYFMIIFWGWVGNKIIRGLFVMFYFLFFIERGTMSFLTQMSETMSYLYFLSQEQTFFGKHNLLINRPSFSTSSFSPTFPHLPPHQIPNSRTPWDAPLQHKMFNLPPPITFLHCWKFMRSNYQ